MSEPWFSAAVAEQKDKPCNICGRGWPYHYDRCAYKVCADERSLYEQALSAVEVALFGNNLSRSRDDLEERARDAAAALRAANSHSTPEVAE